MHALVVHVGRMGEVVCGQAVQFSLHISLHINPRLAGHLPLHVHYCWTSLLLLPATLQKLLRCLMTAVDCCSARTADGALWPCKLLLPYNVASYG